MISLSVLVPNNKERLPLKVYISKVLILMIMPMLLIVPLNCLMDGMEALSLEQPTLIMTFNLKEELRKAEIKLSSLIMKLELEAMDMDLILKSKPLERIREEKAAV